SASAAGQGGVQTPCRELEYADDLVARDRKLFDHLVDGHAVLEVVEHDRDRCSRALEYPGAAHLSRDAFDGGTLGPIECGHAHPPRCSLNDLHARGHQLRYQDVRRGRISTTPMTWRR